MDKPQLVIKTENFSIELIHDLKLVKYIHSGLITADDIEAAWAEIIKIKEFTDLDYNLLTDYRMGKTSIKTSGKKRALDFMKGLEKIVRGKKQALLMNDPLTVALSFIFQKEVKKTTGFNIKIFSTYEKALLWLKQ